MTDALVLSDSSIAIDRSDGASRNIASRLTSNFMPSIQQCTVKWTRIMDFTSVTSREFSQDAARAKKAALQGPVFITDRGRPAHVLLSIDAYRRLTGGDRTLFDVAAGWNGGDFDFEPPKLGGTLTRPVDFD